MKRRTFIWLSTAVSISAMLPLATSCSSVPNFEELLATPLTLMLLNDSKTIRKLGKQHLKLSSTHLEKEMLIALLLKNNQGKEISKSSSTSAIQRFIQKKITQDFSLENTVLIDGWVLSKTEAYQCALFSKLKI